VIAVPQSQQQRKHSKEMKFDVNAREFKPARGESSSAEKTRKRQDSTTLPQPKPKPDSRVRGENKQAARRNSAQQKPKRKRGRRGNGPDRQEKRAARRASRDAQKHDAQQQMYCVQKDVHDMKMMITDLTSLVKQQAAQIMRLTSQLNESKAQETQTMISFADVRDVKEIKGRIEDAAQHYPRYSETMHEAAGPMAACLKKHGVNLQGRLDTLTFGDCIGYLQDELNVTNTEWIDPTFEALCELEHKAAKTGGSQLLLAHKP